ncbi:quinate pathway repressor protein QutR [Aspergillus luchuensis]|uniref:Quinate pathway repressor protein QutR n=1 Tax=Aspergillus kawachii TaxID=1069201 RepID=A0A146FZI7_ASPKA|nr:quinate pathway repressor protein QutR [Aspergillus luchuensis]
MTAMAGVEDTNSNTLSHLNFTKQIYQAGGMPFKVPTPNNNHLMVTSSYHIKELINAPLQSLSLHAVAKEVRLATFSAYFEDC